jgi:hypothetical protein
MKVMYDNHGNLCYVKETKTKEEIVSMHNILADYDTGKMRKYESFDSMLPHIKESYLRDYNIID